MSINQLTKRLLLVLAVLGTLVLAVPAVAALNSYIRIVQITYNSGDVLVAKSASDSPSPVSDFQPLNHDSFVVTEDGIVEIEFENEIIARVAEDSRMHLAELLHRDDGSRFTQLSLQAGTATFITKLRKGDEFIVSTPFFTVLADRKAQFRIDLGEQGGRVQVSKGNVEVQTSTEILQLSKGRQLEWDAANSQIALADLGATDGWDAWNDDRDDAVQAARRRERWSTYASNGGSYGDYHYGHHHRLGYCPYSYYASYGYRHVHYPMYYGCSHGSWITFGSGADCYPYYLSYFNPYYTSYYSYRSGHWRRRSSRRHRDRDRDRDRTDDEVVTRASDNRPKAARSVSKKRSGDSSSPSTEDGFDDARRGRSGNGYGNRRSDWTGRRGETAPTAESLGWTEAVSTTRKSSPARARETYERDTPRGNGTSATTPVRVDRTARRKSARRTATSEGYTRDRTSNSGPSRANRSSERRSAQASARREAASSRGNEARSGSRASSSRSDARSSARSAGSSNSARSSSSSSRSRGASSSSRSRGNSRSSAQRSSGNRSSSSKPKASKRSSRGSSGGSRSRGSSSSSGSSSKSKSKKKD